MLVRLGDLDRGFRLGIIDETESLVARGESLVLCCAK
jgi:hypothetical protein